MMQRISKDAGLSQIYTNHCIRATVITSLDHAGVEGRHIQQVSGHKSISSLQHYAQMASEDQLRSISSTISGMGKPADATAAAATSTETRAGFNQTFSSCIFHINVTR